MASYAYVDKEKTIKKYAKDCCDEDCDKDFYCKTIKCTAIVGLYSVGSDKRNPYFKEKKYGSHIPECIQESNSYKPTDYDEESFDFTLFSNKFLHPNLEKDHKAKSGHKTRAGDGKIKPISSLLTFYYALKSLSPDDYYNNCLVRDYLIDGRLKGFNLQQLGGVRLIECIFQYYNDPDRIFFAKNTIDSKSCIALTFESDELFEFFKEFYFTMRKNHKGNHVSVVIADWHQTVINGKDYLGAIIVNKSQRVVPHQA